MVTILSKVEKNTWKGLLKKKKRESILQLGNLINTCRSIMTSQFYFSQLSSKGTSTNSNYAKNKGQFNQQNRCACDMLLWSVT